MTAHSKQINQLDTFTANELPNGVIDGNNKVFTLANTPVSDTLIVRLSGLVQVPGGSKDYTLSGQTITFTKAPKVGQEVVVSYFVL